MNRSEVGKLGGAAVNQKYSEETRLLWSKRGAQRLNVILSPEHRRKGGFVQDKASKSLGAQNSVKQKQMASSEVLVSEYLKSLGYTFSKERGADFEIHALLKTSARIFEVDFVSFENDLPKLVVEVTSQRSELKGESLAYRAIILKKIFRACSMSQ